MARIYAGLFAVFYPLSARGQKNVFQVLYYLWSIDTILWRRFSPIYDEVERARQVYISPDDMAAIMLLKPHM